MFANEKNSEKKILERMEKEREFQQQADLRERLNRQREKVEELHRQNSQSSLAPQITWGFTINNNKQSIIDDLRKKIDLEEKNAPNNRPRTPS